MLRQIGLYLVLMIVAIGLFGCSGFQLGSSKVQDLECGMYVIKSYNVEKSIKTLIAKNPGMVIMSMSPQGTNGFISEYIITTMITPGARVRIFRKNGAEEIKALIRKERRHGLTVTATAPINKNGYTSYYLVFAINIANIKHVGGQMVLDNGEFLGDDTRAFTSATPAIR